MAADDPVDSEAMIFTEADVYMICGYLARIWGVEDDADDRCADTERAIMDVLAEVNA